MSDQRDLDLAYLAGIWDGEGYIGLSINTKRGPNPQYYPRVTFTTTSEYLLDEIKRILDNEKIPYHISGRDAHNEKYKYRYVLEMVGFRRSLKFLFIMEPILRWKKTQAALLLGFIWSRLRHIKAYSHNPYSEQEKEIFLAMKELNAKGPKILREHTPNAVAFAAKMCSELRAKGAEVTETMTQLAFSRGWNLKDEGKSNK